MLEQSPLVYLVDDDDAVRDGLALLLRSVGLRSAGFGDPQAFLARLAPQAIGCVVLDIRMSGISGVTLQDLLHERGINVPVVFITGHGDLNACRRAFRNGAVDFLSKPVDEQDLIDAIQKGQEVLERTLGRRAEKAEALALLDALTPREREVLDRIAEGFTTRQIAKGLGLSPRTVESHRAAIGAKLGTTSQAEMTRLWLEGRGAP